VGVGGCGEECGDKSAVRSLEDAEEAMPSCPMSKRWSSFILPRGASERSVIFPAKPGRQSRAGPDPWADGVMNGAITNQRQACSTCNALANRDKAFASYRYNN